MKKNLIIIFLCVAYSFKSLGCFNLYYGVNKEGNIYQTDILAAFNKNFNKERNVAKLKKLEAKLKKEKTYMLLSDYSVHLLNLGKKETALEILIELYKHYPNEYKIAANLGTAYELNGQVDSALKYIKRDMELNPNDHEGSEWVHVKILETKLELKKNPNYLNNHTVLQLTEKQKKDSTVLFHINIQLRERFPFSPPPDAIMASLLVDMGDVSANVKTIEYAKAYFQIAREYYGDKSVETEKKIKEMQALMNKYSSVKPHKYDPNNPEVGKNKLTAVNYKTLLDDNDIQKYIVDWSKINTDVKALLAMVDLTKSVQEVKESATNTKEKQTDELQLIPEDKDSVIQKDTVKTKSEVGLDSALSVDNHSSILIYFIIAGIAVVAFLLFFLFRKSK